MSFQKQSRTIRKILFGRCHKYLTLCSSVWQMRHFSGSWNHLLKYFLQYRPQHSYALPVAAGLSPTSPFLSCPEVSSLLDNELDFPIASTSLFAILWPARPASFLPLNVFRLGSGHSTRITFKHPGIYKLNWNCLLASGGWAPMSSCSLAWEQHEWVPSF